MYREDCEYGLECVSDKCMYCRDHSLFKATKKPTGKRNTDLFVKQDKAVANADDSWKDLEQKVADSLNKKPTIKDARRSRASGALWFETGDIVDDILHPECKERAAEKSFSVKRVWLEKATEECKYTDKVMCLPFRFKGDDKIYCIFEHNDIASLITTMKTYMEDNDRLRAEVKALKKEIKRGGE